MTQMLLMTPTLVERSPQSQAVGRYCLDRCQLVTSEYAASHVPIHCRDTPSGVARFPRMSTITFAKTTIHATYNAADFSS